MTPRFDVGGGAEGKKRGKGEEIIENRAVISKR